MRLIAEEFKKRAPFVLRSTNVYWRLGVTVELKPSMGREGRKNHVDWSYRLTQTIDVSHVVHASILVVHYTGSRNKSGSKAWPGATA